MPMLVTVYKVKFNYTIIHVQAFLAATKIQKCFFNQITKWKLEKYMTTRRQSSIEKANDKAFLKRFFSIAYCKFCRLIVSKFL